MIEKLGILSDNHGDTRIVETTVARFTDEKVNGVIHCGDVGNVETLALLSHWPFWFVWGNTDQPDPTWRGYIESLGGHWPAEQPWSFRIQNHSILLAHGHESGFSQITDISKYDFIFSGHTHRPHHRQIGKSHFINPGALHRTPKPSVAVLTLTTHHLDFLYL
ncbi:MAG: hypothetical protein HJJLKODD_02622 [Phycisphaerae bacterium]|nr:hypothetical protein [Phycisphaerae bacterium]